MGIYYLDLNIHEPGLSAMICLFPASKLPSVQLMFILSLQKSSHGHPVVHSVIDEVLSYVRIDTDVVKFWKTVCREYPL